jgi:hypothetical protein
MIGIQPSPGRAARVSLTARWTCRIILREVRIAQVTTAEPPMKTYHALAIVPVIPDDDHVVLRIETEAEGRIGVHMRREVIELFFEHPKTDLLRPPPSGR